MNKHPDTKIFQIGFNLSDTRSLHNYLASNGVSCAFGSDGELSKTIFDNARNVRPLFHGYSTTQAFFHMEHISQDGEQMYAAEALISEIYRQNPNALFLFNSRPVEEWIELRKRSYGHYPLGMKYYGLNESELSDKYRSEYSQYTINIFKLFHNKNNFFHYDCAKKNIHDLNIFFSSHGFVFDLKYFLVEKEVRGSTDLTTHVKNLREAALFFRYHKLDVQAAVNILRVAEKFHPCRFYFREELKKWEQELDAPEVKGDL